VGAKHIQKAQRGFGLYINLKNNINLILNDSLYRTSFYLFISRSVAAACGFLFWIVAARYYSINDVGIATSLISALSLVGLISDFGLSVSLLRFLPEQNNKNLLGTYIIFGITSSFSVALIYILLSSYLNTSLSNFMNQKIIIIFIFLSIINAFISLGGNALIAMKRASLYSYLIIFLTTRIIFLIPLTFLNYTGIFLSFGFAYILGTIFLTIAIWKIFPFKLKIDKHIFEYSMKYSFWIYISNLFSVSPTLIMPIMVLNISGEAEAAKYYIAFALASLVMIIPDSLSTSLLVEGSHGENLRTNTVKSIFMVYILIIPITLFLYTFGGIILDLFNTDYAGAYPLLITLAFANLFIVIFSVFIPIQNVRLKMKSNTKLNCFRFFLLISMSYIFLLKFGIVGVGYAWILSYLILDIIIIIYVKRQGWL